MARPSWVNALSPGDWYEIPNTHMSNVPPGVGTGSEHGKISGWIGAAPDYRTSKTYFVAGGGHASWGGNESDSFNADSENPFWYEEHADSGTDPGGLADYKDDGTPVARHSYYGIWLDEWNDRVMLSSGSPARGTPYMATTDSWEIVGKNYNIAGTHPNCPTGAGGFDSFAVSRCLDPKTGDLFCIRDQNIGKWNRSTLNWTAALSPSGSIPFQGGYATCAFDYVRREILLMGGDNGSHSNYSVAGNSWTEITFTGDAGDITAATTDGQYGMFYVKSLDAYLVRGVAAGSVVYKIKKTDSTHFAVSRFVEPGGASVPEGGQGDGIHLSGPFGRFAYLPKLGGAIYVPQYYENVWFLKIENTEVGQTISGTVDSSLLDRHDPTKNVVSVFIGSNNTSSIPISTVTVTQDYGTCTFRYAGLQVMFDNDYTVAVSRDGGATYPRSANVTISGADATVNLTAVSVLQVGAGRPTYHNPNDVIGVAVNGDVIEIDAGTYTGVQGIWTQNKLTFRGVGGTTHLIAAATITNDKAMFVTQGTDTRFENLEMSGATDSSGDGASVRISGVDLAISCCDIHDNENGLLADNQNLGNILLEFTNLHANGIGDGFTHNAYIGMGTTIFTMRFCYSHDCNAGHLIKTRAGTNYILYNRFMDEGAGNSSYQIDIPNGGLSYVIGNLIQKGPNSDNSGTVINYGEDNNWNASRQLYVVNNTLVNDLGSNLVVFIQVQASASTAVIENNLFVEMDTIASGPNTQTTNIQTTTPNLVNRGAYNYHPTATTPGINGGTDPGTGSGFSLSPVYQYVYDVDQEDRPVVGALDVGAYEYGSTTGITLGGWKSL